MSSSGAALATAGATAAPAMSTVAANRDHMRAVPRVSLDWALRIRPPLRQSPSLSVRTGAENFTVCGWKNRSGDLLRFNHPQPEVIKNSLLEQIVCGTSVDRNDLFA